MNKESIFISGVCKDLSQGISDYINLHPAPDIVLLDAYWAAGPCREILTQFLDLKAKVILATNFYDHMVLDYFLPFQPQGYIYRTCEDFKMITDCIRKVFSGMKCSASS